MFTGYLLHSGDPNRLWCASDAPASTAGDTTYWGRLSQVDTPRGQLLHDGECC